MIKAVVFGLDGTLVDSHDAHFEARRQVLAPMGVTLTREKFDETAGASLDEAVTQLFEEQQVAMPVTVGEVEKLCNAAYREQLPTARRIPHTVNFMSGFTDVLSFAVASGAGRTMVEATLHAVDLEDAFDVVVTRDDVKRGKPDPMLFLVAADRLGVKPHECLVMDHSSQGLEAARRAGMSAIDVRGRGHA